MTNIDADAVTEAPARTELGKTLTATRGVGVAITMIMGSGLLALPGLAYAQAGGSAVYAWLAAAVVIIPLLGVFAQLGARHPNAGGVVGFVQVAFGRRAAAPIAFTLLGACAFGGAAMAITGGNYVSALVGNTGVAVPASIGYLVLVAVLNALGSRITGGLQTVVTALLVLLVAAVAAIPFLVPSDHIHWAIQAPTNVTTFLPTIGLVFFAYTGWELVASTTEEYRNPRRDLPIAVGISFAVIVVLYVGIALAVQFSLAQGDPRLQRAPLAAVLAHVVGSAAGSAVSALGMLIIFATLMGGTWATSRIIFATAREKLLPAPLTDVSAGATAPRKAIALSVVMFGVVVIGHAVGLIGLDTVFTMSAVNFVVGYAASVLAYGAVFRRWWQRGLAVLAFVPIAVVLIGFGWKLLFPAALLGCGYLAHRQTRRTATEHRQPGDQGSA